MLLNPLPLILLAIFGLTFLAKKGAFRWWLRGLVLLLWVLSTPWAANQLASLWEIPRQTRSQLPPVSDVAIVLGGLSDPAVSTPEHLEFNRSAERLTEALALYREGRVKALLITSGSGDLLDQKNVEAPGLAAWARSMGIPDSALVVESASRNTWENAVLSLPLVQARGFHSLVLVTSAGHMRRSEAIFRKAGFDKAGRTLVLWPVDTQQGASRFPFNAVADPNSLAVVQSLMKEAVGYVVYFVQGYL